MTKATKEQKEAVKGEKLEASAEVVAEQPKTETVATGVEVQAGKCPSCGRDKVNS